MRTYSLQKERSGLGKCWQSQGALHKKAAHSTTVAGGSSSRSLRIIKSQDIGFQAGMIRR